MERSKDIAFEELLHGSDERVSLDQNGLTKHFINPSQPAGIINRGNCTCSGLDNEGSKVISNTYKQIHQDGFEPTIEGVAKNIKKHVGLKDHKVLLAPSGSHLCYFPILFHSLNFPGKEITSIVSGSEELGSGSEIAYKGGIFFQYNQFEQKIESDQLNIPVNAISLSARDEAGEVQDNTPKIESLIKNHDENNPLIINLVAGSKSGIIEDFSIIERYQQPNIIWVVDACQYRIDNASIRKLLKLNVVVFITGSKFFEAPPYCGALLVNDQYYAELIKNANPEAIDPGFKDIFSYYDFIDCENDWKDQFNKKENFGLLLRWQIALKNMDKLSVYSQKQFDVAVSFWNMKLKKFMAENPDSFELMSDGPRTTESIISFRIKNNSGNYLNTDELKKLREILALDNQHQLNNKNILIGQPVCFGGKAFIRVSLGVSGVINVIEGRDKILLDTAILELIISLAKKMF